jgi:ABC-type transport system involved in cytochrome c biogenesis ATPase subunit
MLKRFHVKHFRSCKDVVLDGLRSMTALVGRNGSGKTNLLRAIEWLARTAAGTEVGFEADLVTAVKMPLSATVEVELDNTRYRYSLERQFVSPKGVPKLYLNESIAVRGPAGLWESLVDRWGPQARIADRPEPVALGSASPCLPAFAALLPESEPIKGQLHPLLAFFRATRYYPVDERNEATDDDAQILIPANVYDQWVAQYQATGDGGHSVLMRLLHAHRERRSQFQEIESLLGPKGLDLIQKILVQPVVTAGSAATVADGPDAAHEPPEAFAVRFQPGRVLGGRSEPRFYPELSLGTRRVIHLVVSLILDGSSLMLVEHPEDGIHRGLVRKLINVLRANADPGQVILSTHSAAVMNELDAPDVRLVSIHGGATEVRSLTAKEMAAAGRFVEEEGTLGEFLESVAE